MLVMVTRNDGSTIEYWISPEDETKILRKLARMLDDAGYPLGYVLGTKG
jgi:hypothetical protein